MELPFIRAGRNSTQYSTQLRSAQELAAAETPGTCKLGLGDHYPDGLAAADLIRECMDLWHDEEFAGHIALERIMALFSPRGSVPWGWW